LVVRLVVLGSVAQVVQEDLRWRTYLGSSLGEHEEEEGVAPGLLGLEQALLRVLVLDRCEAKTSR
jgi:hypothetical protein